MEKFGKILVGTRDIANNIYMLKTGLQELGCDVTSCSTGPSRFYKVDPDINISELHKIIRGQIHNHNDSIVIPKHFENLFHYDTYFFITESLFPALLDLPILKKMGKRIIFYPTGSDLRFWGNADKFFNIAGYEFPKSLKFEIRNITNNKLEMALNTVYTDTYSNKLHNIRMIETCSDIFCATPDFANAAIRPFFAIMTLSNPSICNPNIPRNIHPIVVLAPSSRKAKYTDAILNTLNILKKEGVKFKLNLLENCSNQKVLQYLNECDVLIDAIAPNKGGLLALEALASGCCVVGQNFEEGQPVPFRVSPKVDINLDNLKEKLEMVLTDKKLRIQMAEAGLEYTSLGINSPAKVAQYLFDSYERAKNEDFDYYSTFFLEYCAPPEGEHVPEYLKQMTWQLMKKHGVAPDFKPKHAFMAGHLPKGVTPEMTMKLPRWDESKFRKKCFWGWWAKDAIYPHGPHGIKGKDDVLEKLADISVKFQC